MHLALKKVPAGEVALMAHITIQAGTVVPLERHIMEGNHLSARGWYLPHQMRAWIESSPDMHPRLMALYHFDGLMQDPSDAA